MKNNPLTIYACLIPHLKESGFLFRLKRYNQKMRKRTLGTFNVFKRIGMISRPKKHRSCMELLAIFIMISTQLKAKILMTFLLNP